MCIIGNQKAQEAKNEVIQNHKQFTMTCPSRSRLFIFTTKQPFLCNEHLQLCIMLFHTSWIFTISKSHFTNVHSHHCYFLSFTDFGLVCSFSHFLTCKIRLCVWDFSCFLSWVYIAMNFFLNIVLVVSHRFLSYFIFHLSSDICLLLLLFFLLTQELFSSMVSLHIFVLFTAFSFNWFLVSYYCGQKRCLLWFQSF